LEENNNEGVTIAESDDKVDHMAPIKEVAEKMGIEIPELVATGDLTVENEKTIIIDDDVSTKPVKKVNKKDIPLPAMHDIFMHKGYEYKIVYINEGQHRFSCEPHKGDY